jgi:hypothetical protein
MIVIIASYEENNYMNNNVRLDWVAELKHGNYIQGIGKLKDENNQYCALGVLCSLYIQKNPGRAAWVKKDGEYYFAQTFGSKIVVVEEENVQLPDVVKYWAGLTKNDPIFVLPEDEKEISLIEVNDNNGEDFDDIAGRIAIGAEKRQP